MEVRGANKGLWVSVTPTPTKAEPTHIFRSQLRNWGKFGPGHDRLISGTTKVPGGRTDSRHEYLTDPGTI